jgi:hypothetical protein
MRVLLWGSFVDPAFDILGGSPIARPAFKSGAESQRANAKPAANARAARQFKISTKRSARRDEGTRPGR